MVKNILWIIMIVIIFLNADLYSQDTSCGIVWGAPVELSSSGIIPRIAVQGDTVHVMWKGGVSLPYLRSTNNGVSWDSLRDLWINDTTREPFQSWILSNEENVYVFWRDAYIPTNMIQTAYRKSSDKGTTWSDNQFIQLSRGSNIWDASLIDNMISLRITYCTPLSGWPNILRSTDAGETWSVSPDSIPGYNMKLALSNGALHIVHQPRTDSMLGPEIEYRRSSDLGNNWSETILLSTIDGMGSDGPSIGVDKNKIMVTWRDTKYGCASWFGCSILGRQSESNGNDWLEEQIITDERFGVKSEVNISRNIVAVTWFDDYEDSATVKVRVSLDGGYSWCPVVRIDAGGQPQVAITSTAVHVVYSNDFKVYYRRGALPIINTEIPLQKNWNLISVPVNASDVPKDNVFPSSVSSAFAYNNIYNTTELLNTGEGYWLKFAQAETVTVSGVPIKNLDIPVRTGWNIIGSISYPVAVSSITTNPLDIIESPFYKYENGYSVADTIHTGKGYWIKVKQDGIIQLRSGN